MRKTAAFILAFVMMLSLIGCGGNKETASKPQKSSYKGIDMSVACIKGPTGVGMASLMEKNENKNCANNYSFSVVSSADEISGKIVTGEINIASVPTNLAAKLYSKTGGKIRMLAVNTLGVLSFIENGNSIKGLSDLKGKTVYSTGEGSNPEYILRHLLEKNGLLNDVKIQFVGSNDDLVTSLISGKAEVAMVPEPVATTVLSKKDTLSRVLSVNSEWEKLSEGELMMGCVVALDSFVEENKEQVNKFLEEYETSIYYADSNVSDTAALCEKYEIIPSAAVAEKAIPECNLVFKTGKEAQNYIEDYFGVLLSFDAQSIGGKLPEKNFYYEK